jgi:hypothetical protein
MDQRQLEELNRTVSRFEEAVRELTRALDRLAEPRVPRGSTLKGLVGSGGMEEREAVRLALASVHRARAEVSIPEPEESAPDAGEMRERREDRRRRELA